MFLKLVAKKNSGEFDNHIIEGQHFNWGWCEEWPENYFLPFPIGSEKDQVMVVKVLEENKLKQVVLKQSIVVFGAKGYLLNDDGKTIDAFSAIQEVHFKSA